MSCGLPKTKEILNDIKQDNFEDNTPEKLPKGKKEILEYLEGINDFEINLLTHQLSYGYFFYGLDKYQITPKKEDVIYSINRLVVFKIKTNLHVFGEFLPEFENHFNSKLGHYFRHLYQIIKLISEEELLDEEDRYKYSKMVRSLLSDYEQIMLYYNSLSTMGANWITPLNETEIRRMCYLARFRLIKNFPFYLHTVGIKPWEVFVKEIKSWEMRDEKFFEMIIPAQVEPPKEDG